jgi:DnaJ-domain-containing protein 1
MQREAAVDIFDRLGNLIRTILDDEETTHTSRTGVRDPDEAAAWEELEKYMSQGAGDADFHGNHARAENRTGSFGAPDAGTVPQSLRRDFRNLEVPVDAPMDEVRKAYKRLVAAYHPDRHSSDPEKLRTATEVTKKLNQSFQRIRIYYEGERTT